MKREVVFMVISKKYEEMRDKLTRRDSTVNEVVDLETEESEDEEDMFD